MSFPIPSKNTFKVNDSTKISCFLDCPRKYFYEYILDWRPDCPHHDLDFGEAWHRAQEVLLTHGYDSVDLAYLTFLKYYRDAGFSEATDIDYAPKNPNYAALALQSYVKQYVTDKLDYETLYTEVAGSVMVSQGQSLSFRIDAILRDKNNGLIRVREHKTTKSDREAWYKQWHLAIQLGTYAYVLYCMFDEKDVWGVEVNGTIFTKKDIAKHVRVPIKKTMQAMNAWHYDVAYWLKVIEQNFSMLFNCSPSAPVMEAFARNPGNCTKYFGCPYHDFCTAWPNPLARCDEVPLGFVEYSWNPADREKEAKKVVRL